MFKKSQTIISAVAALLMSNSAGAISNVPSVSIQLWSVKDTLKTDFKGTLNELAKMGFDGVEFAGDFGSFKEQPEQLKKYLDSLGLVVSGAHVSLKDISAKNVHNTLRFYKKLGTTDVIVGWEPKAWHQDGVNEVVSILNNASVSAKQLGMRIGMHSHQHILDKYRDKTFWDHIAQKTNNDVILQLDVGWTTYVGADPIKYVKRYPCRTKTTHYKANSNSISGNTLPIVNQDGTDWHNLLKANINVGCTEWLVIEQEEYPNKMSQLQAVSASYQGLSDVINQLGK